VLGGWCALKLALLAFAAAHVQFSMDEYHQGGHTNLIAGFYRTFDPIKSVLYVYWYSLARRLTHDTASFMLGARLQSLLLALAVVAMVFHLARRLGRDRLAALFTVAVLLSFSNFMERAYDIRADTVALAFVVLALVVAVGGEPRPARAALVGLLVAAAFLCTQKALYSVVAFGLAWLLGSAAPRHPRWTLTTAYAGGWGAGMIAYGIWFGGLHFARVLHMVLWSPLQYARHGGDLYPGLRLHFLVQTLARNPVAYALAVAGLILACRRWRRATDNERFAIAVSLVLVPLVFAHNQPWPYELVMALPFLSLWAVELPSSLQARYGGDAGVWLLGACLLLVPTVPRNFDHLRYDNAFQNRVSEQAEALLGPRDCYADGIWMVPSRRHCTRAWLWPGELLDVADARLRGEPTEIDALLAAQPKLWILNYRLDALRVVLGEPLRRGYVRVYPNVMLAGAAIVAGQETVFDNRWAGRYRLYDRDGRPSDAPFLLDAAKATGEVAIDLGRHRLTPADGDSTPVRFLFPADVAVPGPLPVRAPPYPLFENIYDI
jgi:hypothetical protein